MSTPVLCELWRTKAGSEAIYVLRCEELQHQITRSPTIITVPGQKSTGTYRVYGYDVGVVQETLSLNGIIDVNDENVVAGDPAYEAAYSKKYPGKLSLRLAALTWWADASWASKTDLIQLKSWGDSTIYYGVIATVQFNLDPAQNFFRFSLSFKVASYPV